MQGRLASIVEGIRASFWFVPAVMSGGAILLSAVTVNLDERGMSEWLGSLRFIYLNQPGGARSLLSTIAGSMMNVAGVVFSLTIVTLTLASQQFGPRLLGNFMRDRGNQFVLGTFVSTFLYCLLILRTVRGGGEEDPAFVPHLSITVALLITLATLAALIYFIHHIASSIQVQNVIGRVASALRKHVVAGPERAVFPTRLGQNLPDAGLPGDFEERSRPVRAREAGYLQTVDGEGLIRLGARHDAVARLRVRPGEFVMHGQHVLDVYPAELPDGAVEQLADKLSMSAGSGQSQDTEALFDQLLELALRALSPASNDPITAGACIDRICDALLELGRGDLPSPYRGDDAGRLRLVVPPFDLPGLARRLFSSLRSALSSNLVAASHATRLLALLAAESDHRELAEVVEQERRELLAESREQLSSADYGSLLEQAGTT